MYVSVPSLFDWVDVELYYGCTAALGIGHWARGHGVVFKAHFTTLFFLIGVLFGLEASIAGSLMADDVVYYERVWRWLDDNHTYVECSVDKRLLTQRVMFNHLVRTNIAKAERVNKVMSSFSCFDLFYFPLSSICNSVCTPILSMKWASTRFVYENSVDSVLSGDFFSWCANQVWTQTDPCKSAEVTWDQIRHAAAQTLRSKLFGHPLAWENDFYSCRNVCVPFAVLVHSCYMDKYMYSIRWVHPFFFFVLFLLLPIAIPKWFNFSPSSMGMIIFVFSSSSSLDSAVNLIQTQIEEMRSFLLVVEWECLNSYSMAWHSLSSSLYSFSRHSTTMPANKTICFVIAASVFVLLVTVEAAPATGMQPYGHV